MDVVVTGANGAVGRAILRWASARPDRSTTFVGIVRSEPAARDLRSIPGSTSRIVVADYDRPGGLSAALADAKAVIHLVGVLVERPGSTYEDAHLRTTERVLEAIRHSPVERLVYVSAVGADERSANRYFRTKGEAEALIRRAGIPHTILRVPLLLGGDAEGAAALRRQVSRRAVMLVGGGRNLQQPLHVDDLARAAMAAAASDVARDRTLELVGPTSLPARELVSRAGRLVNRRITICPVPRALARLTVSLRQRIGGPGFSPDALQVVTADTRLDPTPAAAALGITLTGLDRMIADCVRPQPTA